MNTETKTAVADIALAPAPRRSRFTPGIICGVLVGAFAGAFGQPFVEAWLARSRWQGSGWEMAVNAEPRGEATGRALAAAQR